MLKLSRMGGKLCGLVAAWLVLQTQGWAAPGPALADLHAHLFMHRGLGPLFKGHFNGPVRAKKWWSRFASQANPEELAASELSLVVVALYAHPILMPARRESLRRQIADARAFVLQHPEWVIARSPAEARKALEGGKRVLVLSLEGAGGVLKTDEDLRELIDEAGIRIVTFAHLSDDELSGAALIQGYHVIGNPLGFVKHLRRPVRDEDGVLLNPQGLTPKGERLARELIRRKVWIDLSHSTDAGVAQLLPLMDAAGQPPLMTHTALRRHQPAERQLSDKWMDAFARRKGVVGLVPSNDVLGPVRLSRAQCPASCHDLCEGGLFATAAQFSEMARVLGPENVFIGSDFNGGQQHLPPLGSACQTGTSLDEPAGLFRIGQTGELWSALEFLGAPVAPNRAAGALNFVAAWERVYAGP